MILPCLPQSDSDEKESKKKAGLPPPFDSAAFRQYIRDEYNEEPKDDRLSEQQCRNLMIRDIGRDCYRDMTSKIFYYCRSIVRLGLFLLPEIIKTEFHKTAPALRTG